MATTNSITGDLMVSKSSEAYRDNYDKIFRKANEVKPKCSHRYVSKMDSWSLICVKCGQQKGFEK